MKDEMRKYNIATNSGNAVGRRPATATRTRSQARIETVSGGSGSGSNANSAKKCKRSRSIKQFARNTSYCGKHT